MSGPLRFLCPLMLVGFSTTSLLGPLILTQENALFNIGIILVQGSIVTLWNYMFAAYNPPVPRKTAATVVSFLLLCAFYAHVRDSGLTHADAWTMPSFLRVFCSLGMCVLLPCTYLVRMRAHALVFLFAFLAPLLLCPSWEPSMIGEPRGAILLIADVLLFLIDYADPNFTPVVICGAVYLSAPHIALATMCLFDSSVSCELEQAVTRPYGLWLVWTVSFVRLCLTFHHWAQDYGRQRRVMLREQRTRKGESVVSRGSESDLVDFDTTGF